MSGDWRDDALCREVDGDLFFPSRDVRTAEIRFAVCKHCPVREECLDDAMNLEYEPSGAWGGESEKVVRKMWRAQHQGQQAVAS